MINDAMDAASLAPASWRLMLQDALDDFQLVLGHDQQASLFSIKPVPDADSILIFTAELELENRERKGRSIGSRLYAVYHQSAIFASYLTCLCRLTPRSPPESRVV
ncbi:hypothetical protein F5Y09DRAFT_149921 [Xylaria sp. FL1042]|nr:hypothetical protein F5Y09DRAFT_149921 [Xylaria sp. FL1042]